MSASRPRPEALVGLGRSGATSDAPTEAPPPDPPPPPWWARPVLLAALLGVAQALLVLAWAGALGLRPPSPLLVIAGIGAMAVAARTTFELGGGRTAQLLVAVSLLTCPLVLAQSTRSYDVVGLWPLWAFTLLLLVRAHRLRRRREALVVGVLLGALVSGGSLPSVIVAVGALMTLAGVGTALPVLATLAAVLTAALGRLALWIFAPQSSVAAHSLEALGGLGPVVLLLTLVGVWRAPGLPPWQRPLGVLGLALALGAAAAASGAGAIWPGASVSATFGAVLLGNRVERGAPWMQALTLGAALLAGAAPLVVWAVAAAG